MKTFHWLQKIAFFYAAMFVGIVALNAMPGIHDHQGLMFGLFRLDFIDDALHLASGVWALSAAWHSLRATVFYFKWFGAAYLLDGLMGLAIGKGYLDFGIFTSEPAVAEFGTRLAVNVPHITIGGTAVILGFFLSRKALGQSQT